MAVPVSSRRVRIAVALSTAVLGGSLLGAGAAQAEVNPAPDTAATATADGNNADSYALTMAHPRRPYGTVVSRIGLNVRERPTTHSRVLHVLHRGERVGLKCKVRSQNIKGNNIWYKVRDHRGWIAARYTLNHGYVPYCHHRHHEPPRG